MYHSAPRGVYTDRSALVPTGGLFDMGFRIATLIPEPGTLLLLAVGGVTLLSRRFNPAARRG